MRSREEAASYVHVYEAVARKGCYKHVLEFACAALFPACVNGRLIQPCRSFCEEFAHECSYAIRCTALPDDDHPYMCRQSPDRGATPLMTVQPPEVTNNCSPTETQCNNARCVRTSSWCDGVDDCGDFTDELHCGQESDLDCDFEDGSTCGYQQDTETSHFEWMLQTAVSPSGETGPYWDHTRKNASGHYLLAEASGRYYLDRARLISPQATSNQDQCLRFYYYMFGEDIHSLNVYLNQNGGNETLAWQRRRNHGDSWVQGYVTVPSGENRSVTFEAVRGESFKSDIAIDDITLRHGTCPDQTCEKDEFMCSNNHCLSTGYQCNGINDCGDFSDEYNCECTSKQFRCGFGMCIDDYKRCDNDYDCPDNSDELNCGKCRLGQHTCPDGKCIMKEWLCDRDPDCADGSDEENCATCSDLQFACQDYSCVAATAHCDGVPQCSDASDEEKCFRQNDKKIVEIYKDGLWWPICADGFPKDQLSNVCKEIGMGSFISKNVITTQGDFFMKYTGAGSTKYLSGKLEKSTTCPGSSVLSVLCNPKECGTRSARVPEAYIVHGEQAVAGRWPWQIGLYIHGVYTCGGSLVSHDHVISAAHCTMYVTVFHQYRLLILHKTHND
ncbi:hypothetical protein NP493_380g01002 [Ridgeia piscesae]|uniref:Uncharacterized protein n=1 Tax=Ridgeia piscesae TaxID=27915 RepID=A0AAD9NV38_RIDPI|nr:hypothetical protein NP493_380g01002 [Ridgeia piscesae]